MADDPAHRLTHDDAPLQQRSQRLPALRREAGEVPYPVFRSPFSESAPQGRPSHAPKSISASAASMRCRQPSASTRAPHPHSAAAARSTPHARGDASSHGPGCVAPAVFARRAGTARSQRAPTQSPAAPSGRGWRQTVMAALISGCSSAGSRPPGTAAPGPGRRAGRPAPRSAASRPACRRCSRPAGDSSSRLHVEGQRRRREHRAQQQRHVFRPADARVLHDAQRLLARHRAAQPVAGVGQTVLVEAADRLRRPQHQGREAAHHHAHQREVARALLEPGGLEADPARHRHASEELQGDEEQADLMHERKAREAHAPRA
ncbi:hypothetical protein Ddc_23104 [Ditylenchus destructor]|nr:hypothetical protein Ddc_23104 [Ditylenchus destructor]